MKFDLWDFIKFVKELMSRDTDGTTRVGANIGQIAEAAEEHPLYVGGFLTAQGIPTNPYVGFDPTFLDQPVLLTPQEWKAKQATEKADAVRLAQQQVHVFEIPTPQEITPTAHSGKYTAFELAEAILHSELVADQLSRDVKKALERALGDLSQLNVVPPNWATGSKRALNPNNYLRWAWQALGMLYPVFSNIRNGNAEEDYYELLFLSLQLDEKEMWDKFCYLMDSWNVKLSHAR